MPQLLRQPISFGIASAALFVLLNLMGFNSLFLILSAIPLLYISHENPFAPVLIAGAVASFILLLFSPVSSLFYIAAICVPSLLFTAHLLRGHSLLHATADICGYVIVAFAAMHFSMSDSGGIAGWLATRFNTEQFENLDPALAQQMHWLTTDGSFLLISIAVWWALIFLLTAYWLTQKLLVQMKKADAQQLNAALWHGGLPTWLFFALILSMGIGLIAPENIRFLGTASFVIILLPYFFYGAIHTPLSKVLKASLGWALVVMVVLMVLAWPAFIIAAIGVFKHTHVIINKE